VKRYRALATDGVVVLDGEVVLIERDRDPFEGHWVLPGGMVERTERAREACVREVQEEVGLEVATEAFVGLYDDPDRDERGNVSAAYRCRPTDDAEPRALEEARQVDTFDPEALANLDVGFDHRRIVADALDSSDR
jgi:8-oxo-dGTP diphosphatase